MDHITPTAPDIDLASAPAPSSAPTSSGPEAADTTNTTVDSEHLNEAQLRELAFVIGRGTKNNPPCLFGAELCGEADVSLHLRPCGDPADELVGWLAPVSWVAIGTCCTATVRRLTTTDSFRDRAPTASEGATVTHALSSDGRSITLIMYESSDDPEVLVSAEPVGGLTADACRRALGLPTARPEFEATELMSALWLDAIVSAGARHPGLDMEACWHLHPALGLTSPGGHQSLAERCADASGRVDWEWLRTQAASGDMSHLIDPRAAAWCDDGAFSRLVHSRLPDEANLVEAVVSLLPGQVVRSILGHLEIG